MSDEFYTAPEHGWTCYHCGQTFRVPAQAALHFGTPDAKPGCMMRIKRGEEYSLLYALRMTEVERDVLKVRLICARLGLDRDFEELMVLRLRIVYGILAEMEVYFRKEREREKGDDNVKDGIS